MGSKKHKKESKKKKHRSRSRSPLENEEREQRKKHRKHKDRKRDRSPDVEEVPVDSHLQKENPVDSHVQKAKTVESQVHKGKPATTTVAAPAAPQRSNSEERDRRAREHHRAHRDDSESHRREKEREKSSESERASDRGSSVGPSSGGAAQDSLSIDDTNKLRAKLGLKPLEFSEKPAEDGKFKDDLGEFYHKPATNIAAQKKSEKIREKLDERKERRKIEQKLQTKLLAEDSDEEDASAWVMKSRDMELQKRQAAQRAAMLDEMDEVFGVSALLAADERASQRYSAAELRGLRVAHELDAIVDERDVVLTLADKDVLAEDKEDVLVNVNIVDDERTKKNLLEAKKARTGYRAYDDEAELEAAALGLPRAVLGKYDDEIDRGRAERERGFLIGDGDALEAKKFREMLRQERLQGGGDKRLESLSLPQLRIASDYLDEHEIQAKFKKPRKRGKMRKKAKQEPIDVDDYEPGAAPLHTDDTGDTDVQPPPPSAPLAQDDDETEPDTELQAALARARRLRQAELAEHAQYKVPKMEEILEQAKEEQQSEEVAGSSMVLDATAEFCRTLGDIPTYGLAGNRDHHAEIMDFEREDMEVEPESENPDTAGAWSRVDVNNEKPADLAAGSCVGLEAEPSLGAGVWGALQLALSKGYLERAGNAPAPPNAHRHLLTARHYSIEDKTYGGEDDKYGRRERGGHSGPLQDFREKSNFRPNIKLEYVDDDGRPLCPKEAFRYLSHKFHGKGPGKNKQEKRIKKAVQEGLMKKMSSTDTPLGTLQMLQDKQRETQSPYIVLSGVKRDANN